MQAQKMWVSVNVPVSALEWTVLQPGYEKTCSFLVDDL